LVYKRYTDRSKLIDCSQLKFSGESQIRIYDGDDWFGEVTVYLNRAREALEESKKRIAFAAENLWKMDYTIQKYDESKNGGSHFADSYEAAYLCFEGQDRITLTYYGITENTEFDAVFCHAEGRLVLKSLGLEKQIAYELDLPGFDVWIIEKNDGLQYNSNK
jgi:hypothetical protein